MIWLKSCPRCRGDLFLEREIDGHAVRCLQCSACLNRDQERALGIAGELAAAAPRRRPARSIAAR